MLTLQMYLHPHFYIQCICMTRGKGFWLRSIRNNFSDIQISCNCNHGYDVYLLRPLVDQSMMRYQI